MSKRPTVVIVDDEPDFLQRANRVLARTKSTNFNYEFVEDPDHFFQDEDGHFGDIFPIFLVDWDLGEHGTAIDFIDRAHRRGFVAPYIVITTRGKRGEITNDDLVQTLDAGASNLFEKSIFKDWSNLEDQIQREYQKFLTIYRTCHARISFQNLIRIELPIQQLHSLQVVVDLMNHDKGTRRTSKKNLSAFSRLIDLFAKELTSTVAARDLDEHNSGPKSRFDRKLSKLSRDVLQNVEGTLEIATDELVEQLRICCFDYNQAPPQGLLLEKLRDSHGLKFSVNLFLVKSMTMIKNETFEAMALLNYLARYCDDNSEQSLSKDIRSKRKMIAKTVGRGLTEGCVDPKKLR